MVHGGARHPPLVCSAQSPDGKACQLFAVKGTDPPRCVRHGGAKDGPPLCTARNKAGDPCQAFAVPGTDPPRCVVHWGARRAPTLCTAETEGGEPCRGQAVGGTDPPRCGAHGGTGKRWGPPFGHQNSLKHGMSARPLGPTIDDAIEGLTKAMGRLWALIEEGEGPSEHLTRYLAIYTQATSRLSRLLQERERMGQGARSELQRAMQEVLEELAEEWNTKA